MSNKISNSINKVARIFGFEGGENRDVFGGDEIYGESEFVRVEGQEKKTSPISIQKRADKIIFVAFPKDVDDTGEIIQNLRNGSVCIVNVGHLDKATGKAIQDHIQGAVYYAEGSMEQIDEDVFAFLPKEFKCDNLNSFEEIYAIQDSTINE